MKRKSLFEQKLLLQILSVISAIILWFAVTYAENPSTAISVNNIEINFVGEKILEKNGLIFVNRDKLPGIVVEVRGKRNEVQSVLNSVSATVDLTDITEAGEYTRDIAYSVPNPSVMISKKKTTSVTVEIEKAVSKEIPVKINQSGSNKDYIVKSTAEERTLKISGTAEDLNKINAASVTVDISEMKKSGKNKYPITYVDYNNNTVTPSNRILRDAKDISVNNEVYYKKTVKIEFSPEYDRDNYQINVKGFSIDKLDIGVKDIDTAPDTIYAYFKDSTEISQDGKYEMTLDIPENVYCPQLPEKLTMTADIANIVTRDVEVSTECTDVGEGLTAKAEQEKLTVKATGTEESLSKLKATLSLKGLEAGEYTLPVVFDGNVSVEGSHSVKVKIEGNE